MLQIVLEVDWSAGHAKKPEGALNANDMNMNIGGKQATLRPGTGSTMTPECLGPHPAVLRHCAADGTMQERDCRLRPGQTQHFSFQPGDPPPFYDLTAPPEDIKDNNQQVLREGYVGKPKGVKQVLWERGLWENGLEVDRARTKLAECQDFKTEKSILENLVHNTGRDSPTMIIRECILVRVSMGRVCCACANKYPLWLVHRRPTPHEPERAP